MSVEFTKAVLRFVLSTQYKNTSESALNPKGIKDNLNYTYSKEFTDGTGGALKLRLQYYDQRTLADAASDVLNLDGGSAVTDKWGNSLQYEATKVLIIENTQTEDGRYLKVTFKDEIYYIAPGGIRIAIDPHTSGIEEETPSGSEPDEPAITITADGGEVTYNIFVLGSTSEESGV